MIQDFLSHGISIPIGSSNKFTKKLVKLLCQNCRIDQSATVWFFLDILAEIQLKSTAKLYQVKIGQCMYLLKLWTDFLPEDGKLFLKFFKNMRNPGTEIFASNTAHFHFFQFQKLIRSLKEFPNNYQAIHKSIVSLENKIFLKFPTFGFGLSLFFLFFDSNSTNFFISAYNIKQKYPCSIKTKDTSRSRYKRCLIFKTSNRALRACKYLRNLKTTIWRQH